MRTLSEVLYDYFEDAEIRCERAEQQRDRLLEAGKKRKRWACNNRDCDWVQPPGTHKPETCPNCGNDSFSKMWVQERAGKIDWEATTADLAEKRIELRGAAADEAPGAYKRLDAVLDAQGDTIRILHRLQPIGVAMAGPDIFDPFKD